MFSDNPKPQPNSAGQALGLAVIAGMLFAGTHTGTPAPSLFQTALVTPAAPVDRVSIYQTYAAETEQPAFAVAFNDAYPDTYKEEK